MLVFVDVGRHHLEAKADLAEKLAAARRGGSEDQHLTGGLFERSDGDLRFHGVGFARTKRDGILGSVGRFHAGEMLPIVCAEVG